jgi:hypothetical protein
MFALAERVTKVAILFKNAGTCGLQPPTSRPSRHLLCGRGQKLKTEEDFVRSGVSLWDRVARDDVHADLLRSADAYARGILPDVVANGLFAGIEAAHENRTKTDKISLVTVAMNV